jgi:hypothetical protein
VALRTFERIAAQVVAVYLDEVEGVQEHAGVMPPITGDHGLPIDDAGPRPQPSDGSTISGKGRRRSWHDRGRKSRLSSLVRPRLTY